MLFNDYIGTLGLDQLKAYYGIMLRHPLLVYTSWGALSSRLSWKFKKMQIISYIFPGMYIIVPIQLIRWVKN